MVKRNGVRFVAALYVQKYFSILLFHLLTCGGIPAVSHWKTLVDTGGLTATPTIQL